MKINNKYLIWLLLTTVTVITIIIAMGFIRERQRINHYLELFSQIHPGMTKSQIREIVGAPFRIDTSKQKDEVWHYDVPAIFAESPNCYFIQGDSIMVRFTWEDLGDDTYLVIDSTENIQ